VTSPHIDEGYSEPYPSRSLLRHPASSLDGHRYSSYHDDSHTPPAYQSDLFSSRDDLNRLPPITTIATSTTSKNYESAMTSPAFSETSNTASMGPPSMVSDHTSISSASPRTAASPQVVSSSIPVTRYPYGERRGSAPLLSRVHSPTDPSTVDYGFMLGIHSLDGTKPSDCTATPYPGLTLPPLHHRHSNSASDSTMLPVREDRFPHRPTPAPLQPTRDSRMGLNSLLNQD
jgi:Myb-like DNA-binding protein FlbD